VNLASSLVPSLKDEFARDRRWVIPTKKTHSGGWTLEQRSQGGKSTAPVARGMGCLGKAILSEEGMKTKKQGLYLRQNVHVTDRKDREKKASLG